MKLYYSTNSPYARKCRILVLEKDLEKKVEFVNRMPLDNPIPEDLLAANPLARVPALVLDDGSALTESNVICEYLDAFSKPHLITKDGKQRMTMLRHMGLIDGILDAAVHCVMESRRPSNRRWPEWTERKEDSIMRTLAVLEKEISTQPISMTAIGLGVMLGYLDFRLPHLNWRSAYPQFMPWYGAFSQRPSMQKTLPVA